MQEKNKTTHSLSDFGDILLQLMEKHWGLKMNASEADIMAQLYLILVVKPLESKVDTTG